MAQRDKLELTDWVNTIKKDIIDIKSRINKYQLSAKHTASRIVELEEKQDKLSLNFRSASEPSSNLSLSFAYELTR